MAPAGPVGGVRDARNRPSSYRPRCRRFARRRENQFLLEERDLLSQQLAAENPRESSTTPLPPGGRGPVRALSPIPYFTPATPSATGEPGHIQSCIPVTVAAHLELLPGSLRPYALALDSVHVILCRPRPCIYWQDGVTQLAFRCWKGRGANL